MKKEEIKKYDESIIEINVLETNSDSYSFLWGGEGKVILFSIFGLKKSINLSSLKV